MKSGVLIFWGLIMLGLAGMYGWRLKERSAPVVGEPIPIHSADTEVKVVQPFTLTDQNGETVTADSLRGKVWIASFFFANCPGVCLKMNQTLADLHKDLEDEDVTFVSVTVDPEHDTPERLLEYSSRFGADPKRWRFLTGKMSEIKRLAMDSFQVAAGPAAHTERFMLIDRQGRVQGSYAATDEAKMAALKKKVAALTKESS